MRTVRFQSVIDAAGTPEQHLLWTPPEKDKDLQKAVKEHRVMTVHQSVVGTRADYGTVGLDKTPQSQILVFPKSLAKFEGKRVVAIRYDLYTDAPVIAPPAKRAKPKAPAARKRARQRAANVLEFPKAAPEPRRKFAAKPTSRSEPAPPSQQAADPKAELAAVKRKVRQALKALEQGKQVAAYEALKNLVQ